MTLAPEHFVLILAALGVGALVGWLVAGRRGAALAAEVSALRADRDEQAGRWKQAVRDLEAASHEREQRGIELERLRAEIGAGQRAHAAQVEALTQARDALAAQFQEVGARLLDRAQAQFLDKAGERFAASEAAAGEQLRALVAPVHDRLKAYEETVGRIEAERQQSHGSLSALMEEMKRGQEAVRDSANNLVNSLRNAPKARGRWGEQQLKNLLESCGLAEHVDFQTEVSRDTGDGRLRPDVIVRIPGGRSLVIDAKVSLNAYQDAHNAMEHERDTLLTQHASAMKAHVTTLGAKSYQSQFDDTPDFVIMFVPGEHFVSAALAHDPGLWDFAFERKVLLATPTNMVAILRTVGEVWRQEKLAGQAREIGQLGKDLYARMVTMGTHLARLGKNLDAAVAGYNQFVGSFESQVLTQARRFETLDIETGGKEIPLASGCEQAARPLTKLAITDASDALVEAVS